MSAAITFLLALILLIAFVAFRFWEERKGARLWAHSRSVADEMVDKIYTAAVVGSVPAEYRTVAIHFLHTLAHDVIVFLVESLRSIERPLTRLSYRMRQSVPAPSGKEPSAFLKTITPEKKSESENTINTI